MSAMISLSGWGRSTRSHCQVAPLESNSVPDIFASEPRRGVALRGLGRSYGDAAQNAGGLVLDATTLSERVHLDTERGRVRVSAGISLDTLIRRTLPKGWVVAVTPGTRHVTIGGAIAADVHGKNHHSDGAFSAHCTSIELHTPADGPVTLYPGDELFDATTGGMGLTGIITEAELQLVRIPTGYVQAETTRVGNLEDLIEQTVRAEQKHRFAVAWIDLSARGSAHGRGIVTSGDYARAPHLDSEQARHPLRFEARAVGVAPNLPTGLLNKATIAVFNEVWFRRAARQPSRSIRPFNQFFYPLDGIEHWNRLYGPRGFIQYQFVVPTNAIDTLRWITQELSRRKATSFLSVLKRLGPGGAGHLSFPIEGWTLAVDLPALPRFAKLLDEFDERIVDAGGRIYLAKDGRMRGRYLKVMYPRLEEWRAVRRQVDPDLILTSDLDRRLDLSGRQ